MKIFGITVGFGDWRSILLLFGSIAGFGLLMWGLVKLNHLLFQKVQRKQKNLKLSFFQHLTDILIIVGMLVLCVSSISGFSSVWQTLLGGTAIVSAVLVFAAQDVIKDLLAGLMLSIHRPFELGNRIELENGTAGIVEEMTLRHVVIHELDNARVVIPNSKINAMTLVNNSYQTEQRSQRLRFSIGYDSDLERARDVIAEAVRESPYTVPEDKPDGTSAYRPVYFLTFADSALVLTTTVYYLAASPTEVVKDDVNTRVREALVRNGIEIPYNYINVIQQSNAENAAGE